MKAKHIIIILIAAVVLVCGFLFIRGKYLTKPEKGEVVQFLNAFNTQVKAGNADSARLFFETGPKSKGISTLLNVLTGKTSINGKSKPLFKVSLNIDDSHINFVNPELSVAIITASFAHDGIETRLSTLTFTIHKVGNKQYKIYKINTDEFAVGYSAYQNLVINKTTPEKDIYNPITLAAFKAAEQLKTRYDSVLWFDHVNNKTFYYVIKGKVGDDFYSEASDKKDQESPAYKMGLVNPDLKEIIPAEYDMIHNIGGTIDSLIEVEKGNKRGLYNLDGKNILPVNYDQIFPLKDGENLALLKNTDGYYYLKNDLSISDKITDLKIADVLSKIKTYGDSYTLSDKSSKNIMEFNSRDTYTSLIIAPSYLVDWQILPKFIHFQNPLRKLSEDTMGDGDGSLSLSIKFDGDNKEESNNWFQSAFYSVVDDYLGGRSGLYTTKKVLLVDKKQNRILSFNADSYFGEGEGGGKLSGSCNENYLRALNDSLFEFKTTSVLGQALLDSSEYLDEGPHYHYLQIKAGKLVALKSVRQFPTQYVKLDDSYLQGCYVLTHYNNDQQQSKTLDHITPAILQLMKNEIYASYQYKFKNERWNTVFINRFDKGTLANVDDSLTTIDKYNISFINNKLNGQKGNTLAAK
ncbi:MAG: hypothetical protein JWR38_3246 [Mucilaginibacter sp.]|nr:hypothetical protein [Mucilaginibacter sp.]